MLIEISFVYLLILFLNLYFADDISVGVFNLRTNVFLCYFYSFFTNDRTIDVNIVKAKIET